MKLTLIVNKKIIILFFPKTFVFFSYLYNILAFACLTFSDIELMMASNTSTNSSHGMADEKPMSRAASGTNILITYYKLNE